VDEKKTGVSGIGKDQIKKASPTQPLSLFAEGICLRESQFLHQWLSLWGKRLKENIVAPLARH